MSDERVSCGSAAAAPHPASLHRPLPIPPGEELRLLGSVALGRIVFTQQALPAIRPVNHIVDDGDIVVRTRALSALALQVPAGSGRGVVVAYEADDIDPLTHLGRSVAATGYAHLVTGHAELQRYGRLLQPWVEQPMDCTVTIRPELITGVRLAA
ncbi:pyridoxamine 5'-phosphate oxidase family protein [Streptomyces sp. NPDC101225]|uniref:pyridoxamine 5'-phosphate oxidase family protein n=1 Tax=Streptomyces sp. NPDC101225 TaxID=3366135 RepID=UPI00381A0CE5